MKTVLVMRHGPQVKTPNPVGGIWDLNAQLSTKGRNVIKIVAKTHLAGMKLSVIVSSPVLRAVETATIVAANVEHEGFITLDELLGPDVKSLGDWNWLKTLIEERPSCTPGDMYQHNRSFTAFYGRRVGRCIMRVVESLPDNSFGLVISHQPLCEFGTATVTGYWPPEFTSEKGGIIRLDTHPLESWLQATYLPVPK